MPSAEDFGDDRLQFAETLLDQFEPALRLRDQIGAARNRGLIAVDADHARAGRLQDRTRIAAGAEGAVDIEPAVAHREPFDDAVKEDRNMTGSSAEAAPSSPAIMAMLRMRLPPTRTPNSTSNCFPCTRR